MRRWWWVLVGCWLVAGCGATPSAPITIRSTASADTTVSSTVLSDDRVEIAITSPGGIGESEIIIEGGRSPRRVVVLLHVRGLEQLRLHYGGKQIEGFITSTAPYAIHQQLVALATPQATQDLGPDSPFWMPLRLVAADASTPTILLANGWIEVELPMDFYASSERTFTLSWVDFYR